MESANNHCGGIDFPSVVLQARVFGIHPLRESRGSPVKVHGNELSPCADGSILAALPSASVKSLRQAEILFLRLVPERN